MESSSAPTCDHHQLHIFFFPFLASGHLIPLLDLAKLFAERRGVRVSVATTPANASRAAHAVDEASRSGQSMQLLLLPFAPEDVDGLPSGCQNTDWRPMSDHEREKHYNAIQLLRQPLEGLLRQHRPDCLIADEMYPWTSDLAISLGIPRIVFNATSHFTVCILNEIEFHDAHLAVSSDTEPFIVPGGLPHKIHLTKAELPKLFNYPKLALDMFRDSERKSYGVVMNSFDELAPEYTEQLKKGHGQRRIWNVGPLWLCNRTDAAQAMRGGIINDQAKGIKNWLDAKDCDASILYVSFGTECIFSNDQLTEIAVGLEASDHPFIWVVRGGSGGLDTIEQWLPKGFEERVEGKGLILRGWAPQLLILNHRAVGGFLTHCGWNSTMEALSSGVPMITWPLDSEQFINERLIVQVLGIGVTVLEGVKRSVCVEGKEVVRAEAVRRVVDRVIGGGEEADEMRRRAKKYKDLSRSVLEEGGSSYVNLTCLIEELTALAQERRNAKDQY